jgi:glycosyltransferase involved in cell wall biosynthesis
MARFASFLWTALERLSIKKFYAVIAVDSFIAGRIKHPRMTTIANFPRRNTASIARPWRKKSNPFRVLYIGNLSPSRGLVQTIEAVNLLQRNDIEMHIIGGSNDPKMLHLFNTSKYVKYHGRIAWDEVPKMLRLMDLGTLLLHPSPSYINCRGEGIVKLWEYMAAGLPVLISNFPKFNTLIADLRCGRTVDPLNPLKIAQEISFFADNRELSYEMGERGREQILLKYNWEKEEEKLLKLYRTISQS